MSKSDENSSKKILIVLSDEVEAWQMNGFLEGSEFKAAPDQKAFLDFYSGYEVIHFSTHDFLRIRALHPSLQEVLVKSMVSLKQKEGA